VPASFKLVLGRWRWDGEAPTVCHAGVAIAEMGREGGGSRTVTPVWGTGGGPRAGGALEKTQSPGDRGSRRAASKETERAILLHVGLFLLGFVELRLLSCI